jgi:hypothetical protein
MVDSLMLRGMMSGARHRVGIGLADVRYHQTIPESAVEHNHKDSADRPFANRSSANRPLANRFLAKPPSVENLSSPARFPKWHSPHNMPLISL